MASSLRPLRSCCSLGLLRFLIQSSGCIEILGFLCIPSPLSSDRLKFRIPTTRSKFVRALKTHCTMYQARPIECSPQNLRFKYMIIGHLSDSTCVSPGKSRPPPTSSPVLPAPLFPLFVVFFFPFRFFQNAALCPSLPPFLLRKEEKQ